MMSTSIASHILPAFGRRPARAWYLAAAALALAAILAGGCADSEGELSGQAGGGLPMPDQITGFAWQDENGDGVRNAGEAPAAGQEVVLRTDADRDGVCDALDDVVATAVTDVQGRYEFSTLAVGSYCVEVGPGHSGASDPTVGFGLDFVSGGDVEVADQ